MGKAVILALGCVVAGLILFSSTGCHVNLSNPPYVQLDTIVGYVYEDTTVPQGSIISMYVFAARSGNNDILETGTIRHQVNNGPDSIIQKMVFASTQFTQFYSYIAGKAGNTERYTFTFGNENGQTDSVSVAIKDTI